MLEARGGRLPAVAACLFPSGVRDMLPSGCSAVRLSAVRRDHSSLRDRLVGHIVRLRVEALFLAALSRCATSRRFQLAASPRRKARIAAMRFSLCLHQPTHMFFYFPAPRILRARGYLLPESYAAERELRTGS
jgi:hypothetical protein